MEQARSNWNDDRLDHLAGRVDRVADQVIVTLASLLATFVATQF
jgi:hypothetical protein